MSLTISALNSFSKDPENIEFIDFLVEKTKDVTGPLSIWNLCEEFKTKSGSIQSKGCLLKRIYRFLPLIHELPNIGKNTKVKLLFGLSAPINYGFLKELEKHADITVDSARLIIEYKEKGGGLQLKRLQVSIQPLTFIIFLFFNMKTNKVNTLDTEIMKFLAEAAKVADSPISVTEFTRRFKTATGTSASIRLLYERYFLIKKIIYESDFDEETKIRMLFVSGAELHDYVLKELQRNAHIEVDERCRIISYTANDGSFIDGEEEMETDEEDPMISNPNTPNRKRKIGGSMVGSSLSKRNAMEVMDESFEVDDFSFDDFQPMQTPRRVKLELFEVVLIDRTIDGDDDDIQIYFPEQTESLLIPKKEDQLANEVKFDRPDYLLFAPSAKTAPQTIELKKPNNPSMQTREDINSTSDQRSVSSSFATELT